MQYNVFLWPTHTCGHSLEQIKLLQSVKNADKQNRDPHLAMGKGRKTARQDRNHQATGKDRETDRKDRDPRLAMGEDRETGRQDRDPHPSMGNDNDRETD